MLCVCRDGSVKLIDIATKKFIKTYEGFKARVIKKSPCNKLIIGSEDGSVKILNSENGECIKTFNCAKTSIEYIFITSSNTFLSFATFDQEYKLFNLNNFSCIKTIDFSVTDSLDVSNEKLATIKWDHDVENYNKICITNVSTDECLKIIEEDDLSLTKILSNELIATGSVNGDIKIWNIETGNCLKTMKGHTDDIFSIIKLTQETIASCTHKTIIIWNFNSGELLKLFEFRNNIIIFDKVENGKKIIIFDKDEKIIKFFDIENDFMTIIKDKIDCINIEVY
jgi:WD40 repeat protein